MAREKLAEKNWYVPSGFGEDHRKVIRTLKSRKFRLLGDYLETMMYLRQHADYHIDSVESDLNRKCQYCKTVRSRASSEDVVSLANWTEAAEIGEHFFPLIEKL